MNLHLRLYEEDIDTNADLTKIGNEDLLFLYDKISNEISYKQECGTYEYYDNELGIYKDSASDYSDYAEKVSREILKRMSFYHVPSS